MSYALSIRNHVKGVVFNAFNAYQINIIYAIMYGNFQTDRFVNIVKNLQGVVR